MKYIVANWKANKNYSEAEKWIKTFVRYDLSQLKTKIRIVICPPFPFIPLLNEKTKDYPFIKIGAQNISVFPKGTYTGEVTAENLVGLIDYVILGHSERRRYFKEKEKVLFKKFILAKKWGIEPLFCIRGEKDNFPYQTKFVVYEPVTAISDGTGVGNNQPLEKILTVKEKLKLASDVKFIYGGSVNEENADYYLENREINGLLIGGASLDPQRFYKIIKRVE